MIWIRRELVPFAILYLCCSHTTCLKLPDNVPQTYNCSFVFATQTVIISIFMAQQKALEDIDAMHRAKKLVILGLNEYSNEGDVIDEMFNILQVESEP